ncbi:MAG: nucleotide sugar dehydrogenase [Deltaproteobacteria bacterium]|nr:nucleotide sugar dehydrogenase [Deltaproteobacteria bacterium]
METLARKFKDKTARIVVVGAGYVGLPLAVEAARAGLETIAFDVDEQKVRAVNAGTSYVGDVPDTDLKPLVESGKLRAAADPVVMAGADAVIICVPTPLNKTKDPDVSMIMSAAGALLPHLHRDQLVVLESTTYPGFTREVLKPALERTGLKVGRDVFLAFSPERVDPGNPRFQTRNTPKVIGGMTDACQKLTVALYSHFIEKIVPVTSCDSAEMVKILENTFRAVNIGLVNEVALMCKKLGINTWEVIDAASTKPFGFMPFYPGPGLGGHCIPVDPHYLSWKLRTLKYNARFIELAGVINSGMPEVVTQLVADAMNDRMKTVNGSKILVLGVAYKPDIEDVRESPSLDVIELLAARGGQVSYHDPYVPKLVEGHLTMESVPFDALGSYDCVVIVTHHKCIDYLKLCKEAQLVVDTRNATKGLRSDFAEKIVTL